MPIYPALASISATAYGPSSMRSGASRSAGEDSGPARLPLSHQSVTDPVSSVRIVASRRLRPVTPTRSSRAVALTASSAILPPEVHASPAAVSGSLDRTAHDGRPDHRLSTEITSCTGYAAPAGTATSPACVRDAGSPPSAHAMTPRSPAAS